MGILIVIIFTLFAITNCEPEPDSPPINQADQTKVLQIKDIYQIYEDSGENYKFSDNYMLYANVIMDDSSGNIYKEAYIQDSTGGINLYKLTYADMLKVGDYVRINLKDTKLKNYSGKMEIVFEDIYDATKNVTAIKKNNFIEPAEVSLEDIFAAHYDCERVKISEVQFADNQLGLTYANRGGTSSQNRTLVDCSGKSIIVRTSDYAKFAGDTLPNGNGDIIGVITKYIYSGGDTAWQLLVRNPNEFSLNNPRCR